MSYSSFVFMHFSTTMEAQRQRISDLLDAQVPNKEIIDIVKCSRRLVSTVKKLKEDGETLKRKPGSGGHNKVLNNAFMDNVAASIEAEPTKSMRKMAKTLDVDEKTIRTAVSLLGAHSYVRRRRQLLTATSRASRVERGKKLLSWQKKKDPSTVLVFSDKKNWTVDQARNARNDRYLAYNVCNVPSINETKHPSSAMMLGVVTSDGKRMPPYWFPKGLKIGTKEYLDVMSNVVKPWLEASYPSGNYVWQQDSAPGHKAKVVQDWCRTSLSNFWPWKLWPPSSPDCSPLDYGIWGYIKSRACSTPHPNIDSLKASVEEEWATMSNDYVIKVCKAFRPRIEAMIAANGGHFEK